MSSPRSHNRVSPVRTNLRRRIVVASKIRSSKCVWSKSTSHLNLIHKLWILNKHGLLGCAISLRLYTDGLPFYALRSSGCASQNCDAALASCPSIPHQRFGLATKVHLLPSGEAEWRIVAYGLMQRAKNPCITGFEAAEVGARPVQRGSSTIFTAQIM